MTLEIIFTESDRYMGILKDIIKARQQGKKAGIPSYCTANPVTIESVMRAYLNNDPVSYTHLDVYKRQAVTITPARLSGVSAQGKPIT